MGFRQEILDLLQVTGILIVFVTLLFVMKYEDIQQKLRTGIPHENEHKERNRQYKMLGKSLFLDCLPVVVINAALVCLLTPLAFRLIAASAGTLSFGSIGYAFLLILLLAVYFLAWSLILTTQVFMRWYELRR